MNKENKNKLLYWDNLEILLNDKLDPRQAPIVPDDSVDVIYIDPPFNSNRD
jgi:16S rRNA G966 N2-methylase RsmD